MDMEEISITDRDLDNLCYSAWSFDDLDTSNLYIYSF